MIYQGRRLALISFLTNHATYQPINLILIRKKVSGTTKFFPFDHRGERILDISTTPCLINYTEGATIHIFGTGPTISVSLRKGIPFCLG